MRNIKGSWIDSYLKYTKDQESPKAFHTWVAMAILSAAIRRNVVIPRVMYKIYPNLFIILVAGSAKCRKSVSLHIGEGLLKSMETPPMVFSQKITPEALIASLKEATEKDTKITYGLILASELSVFLGSDAIKNGMIPILTDLYDSRDKWEYKTRARGTEQITNVTLSMLGASTMDWIKTSIPKEAIGGGFTSRVVFVFEDAPSKLILFQDGTVDDIELKRDLIHDLNLIGSLKGTITFTDEAKKKAWLWYESESSQVRNSNVDGYFGRKHDTMFKVASILSLAEEDTLIVDENHIDKALDMLAKNEVKLEETLESVSSSIKGEDAQKVLLIIKRFSPITHSELLKKCWRFSNATELAEIMNTLVEGKEVLCNLDGKNARVYRRNE